MKRDTENIFLKLNLLFAVLILVLSAPVYASEDIESIDTKIILDKQVYAVGDLVNITVVVKNVAAFQQRIEAYPLPDFTILNADRERIYRHHDLYTPPPVLFPIELKPQEEYTYALSWNQKNYKGEQVEAGEYILSVHVGFGPGGHGRLMNNTVIKISDRAINNTRTASEIVTATQVPDVAVDMPKAPGFEAVFAVLLLISMVYIIKRRN